MAASHGDQARSGMIRTTSSPGWGGKLPLVQADFRSSRGTPVMRRKPLWPATTPLHNFYISLTNQDPSPRTFRDMKNQCKLARTLRKTAVLCAVAVSALAAYGETNN